MNVKAAWPWLDRLTAWGFVAIYVWGAYYLFVWVAAIRVDSPPIVDGFVSSRFIGFAFALMPMFMCKIMNKKMRWAGIVNIYTHHIVPTGIYYLCAVFAFFHTIEMDESDALLSFLFLLPHIFAVYLYCNDKCYKENDG